MSEHEIIELQSKSAHQEYLLQQLNDALISQQDQINALSASLKRLETMLKKQQDNHIAKPEEEVPPPHY